MRLVLTCYRCGHGNFTEVDLDIFNKEFLFREYIPKNKVICNKCKMEDYVQNLVIKIEEC